MSIFPLLQEQNILFSYLTHWLWLFTPSLQHAGSSCANEELLRSIPKELVTWSGVIQLEMKCLDGYDPPLNMPDYKIFQCKPDGSAWDPPIFPDCTSKLLRKIIKSVQKECKFKRFWEGINFTNLTCMEPCE